MKFHFLSKHDDFLRISLLVKWYGFGYKKALKTILSDFRHLWVNKIENKKILRSSKVYFFTRFFFFRCFRSKIDSPEIFTHFAIVLMAFQFSSLCHSKEHSIGKVYVSQFSCVFELKTNHAVTNKSPRDFLILSRNTMKHFQGCSHYVLSTFWSFP